MTWDFLHRWYMPFLWLAISSLVSVPMAIYFQHGMNVHQGAELGLPYGHEWVLRDEFLESIVPYLLNFGCAIWLFNASRRDRAPCRADRARVDVRRDDGDRAALHRLEHAAHGHLVR